MRLTLGFAVLACSDRRFLPERHRGAARSYCTAAYAHARRAIGTR